MQKKAGIRRGKVKKRNQYRPAIKVPDFGFSHFLTRIERVIELIDRRR